MNRTLTVAVSVCLVGSTAAQSAPARGDAPESSYAEPCK